MNKDELCMQATAAPELPLTPELFTALPVSEKSAERMARPRITYLSDAWRRFKENRMALIAMCVLCVLILLVVFAPILSPYGFSQMDTRSKHQLPSWQHWFGTDELGRDIFTRIWVGGRVSIAIGLVGALISAVVGTLYGAISAFSDGIVDNIMMRIVEILNSIPYLLYVILIQLFFRERSLGTMILALTITGWLGSARMVRGQLLALKNQDFVLAAQTLGVPGRQIILKHLIPNTMNIIIIAITFDIPGYIFSEAFLSYLGIGIEMPMTSWGAMASAAQSKFLFYPLELLWPSLMIAITMLSFVLMGDGLRDALDPRLRT